MPTHRTGSKACQRLPQQLIVCEQRRPPADSAHCLVNPSGAYRLATDAAARNASQKGAHHVPEGGRGVILEFTPANPPPLLHLDTPWCQDENPCDSERAGCDSTRGVMPVTTGLILQCERLICRMRYGVPLSREAPKPAVGVLPVLLHRCTTKSLHVDRQGSARLRNGCCSVVEGCRAGHDTRIELVEGSGTGLLRERGRTRKHHNSPRAKACKCL